MGSLGKLRALCLPHCFLRICQPDSKGESRLSRSHHQRDRYRTRSSQLWLLVNLERIETEEEGVVSEGGLERSVRETTSKRTERHGHAS